MKKKKVLKRVLIGFASFIIIGILATTFFTGYMVFANSTQLSTNENTTVENSIAYFERIGFDYEGFKESYSIETVEIVSTYDGHVIPTDLIVSQSKDADTVVMIHGLGGNRQSVFPYAKMFLEQGYNILTYDQRSSGENTAQYTTFGYLESFDTADCVNYLDSLLSKDSDIYVWGVSNGAATAGISARHEAVESRVTAIILDCPISNTDDMLRVNMQDMDLGLPLDFLMLCGNLYNRMILGFSYSETSTVETLRDSELPVLIIATKADETTPYWMAEKIHEAVQNSTLEYVEDSSHADILFDYPEWYAKTVFEFINIYS